MLARHLFCCTCLFALIGLQDLHAADVMEHTLENGLTVLVLPDPRAPVVTNQVWYGVGAMHEHSGITGISHMLEHMMFRGSEVYPPGEFAKTVSALGGRLNAFTSRDFTAYFEVVGSRHWEQVMAMEAERMRGLRLSDEEFAPEREVVVEERRLTLEDRPVSVLREQFHAAAFLNQPYRHSVIGWMSDIKAYTIDDLQNWYASWYAPNNAVLVVVGDVQPEEVIDAATLHFGTIAPRDLPVVKPRRETPQKGERRVTVRLPAKVPHLMLGWKAPALLNLDTPDDAYALMVAAGVLSAGRSARLDRDVVRTRELAQSAAAGYNGFSRMDGLFTISATPSADTNVQILEQALLDEVEKLRTIAVPDNELERVKAQVVAADIYQRDSINARAFELGMLQTVGLGWEVSLEYMERIQDVSAEDVQRVARRYLRPDALTVGILHPLPIEAQVIPEEG